MVLYRYTALDSLGKKHKGVVDAHDEKEAKEKLRQRQLMVASLSAKTQWRSKESLRGENLLAFTVQLAQLINAGVPIFESLQTLEEQYNKEPFHRVLVTLCENIKRGSSLSESMSQFPDSFDKMYLSMVSAGEAAGVLGLVLERLGSHLTKQSKLKKELSSALIYPCILAGFCTLVIAMLLGFVVPSIEGIFEGRKLNSFTEFVLGVSHFAREKWWIYIPLIGGIIGFVVYQMRTEIGAKRLQRMLLKLPYIRTLVINSAVARFSRTMATLLRGGLPIIESLKLSSDVMHNVAMEEEMGSCEKKIVEGSSLSQELKRSKFIPKLVSRMVAIGEETGNAVTMFEKVADMYEDSLEKSLSRIVALTQPVILIVMGGIIGAVMMAILLPLTEIASFTSN